jgi:hypothetical protein
MDDATKLELEAMKIEAMAFAELMMFDDNPEPKAEEIRRIATRIRSLAAEKPGDATPDAEASRKLRVEHVNGLWKRATGCAAPAEAQNLIFRLKAKIERMGRDREHPNSGDVYGTGKAPPVDIELLRRCYRAMMFGQHDQAGQLDSAASAAMALARAYPEVTK